MNRCGVQSMFMITVLITIMSTTSSELLRPAQPPQHNYAFNKFRPPPPQQEPSFFQRVTSWFFPWGGVTSEEEFRVPAAPKNDLYPSANRPQVQYHQQMPISRTNPVPIRDTEPTTARTTPSPPITKCSPCNKVPWIPMMPTYQLPLVKQPVGQQQQDQQVYFKHHFGNENQYAQVPVAPGYSYGPPTTTQPPTTTPIKYQDGSNVIVGRPYYGAPPIKNVQFQNYQLYPNQPQNYPKPTTYRPNTNTIDTSVVTFTTNRPQNNRPSRFTAAGSVTNPEYLPPPNILPLEGENSNYAPIPIPNLSPTPIPPLFDARPFHDDPYRNQKTGFIKLVPLEPVAQLSNNVNVQIKPERNLPEFEAIKESPAVEVISSNLVAEFTLPPQIIHFDATTRPTTTTNNFRLNLDFGNNLDVRSTARSPFAAESVETVTDNAVEGSELNYEHNINQAIEDFSRLLKNQERESIEEAHRVSPTQDYVTSQESVEEEFTTTEGNYIIKFEPSLQTAADLAEQAPKKPEPLKKNRDRLTPLELLDSPIQHITLQTLKPNIVPVTEPIPPFKPLVDFTKHLSTLWTTSIPISTSTEPTPTPTYTPIRTTRPTTTAPPSTTLSFLSRFTANVLSRITPPREPPKAPASTKKPKQIQIVIPYTTFNKPSPFKIQEEQEPITYRPIRGHYVTHPPKKNDRNDKKTEVVDEGFNGHGYHNDQEYPDHAQESKIVESKVTIEPSRTTKYFTKILANNIRDLLKKEKTPKPPRIDLIKLQKNIDGWTEQSFKGKQSTISLLGHTKTIPTSFLSTAMMKSTTVMLPTTTLSPKATFDPDLMEEARLQYDNILYKKDDDALYVKRHDRYLDRDNELVLINNNLTHSVHRDGVKVFAPKTTLTPKELWKRLHLTVSPLTNEKIYVVTPQPRHQSEESVTTFRPRFAVRPTVASKKQPKKLKPEASRRMDDEAEIEFVDEHSEIVRIITPQQEVVTRNSLNVTPENLNS